MKGRPTYALSFAIISTGIFSVTMGLNAKHELD